MKINMIYEMIAHHYINRKKVTIPVDMANDRKLMILATGTSANEFWNNIDFYLNKYRQYDYLVMNRTIYKMKEQVMKIKPKYLAMCDSIYWGAANGSVSQALALDTYHRTREVLEQIDWECYLVTTIQEKFDFHNDNVKIIRINSTKCEGDGRLAYWLYKNNFAHPGIYNVTQLAIYFGITFLYKEIGLVGLDFDFIKNLNCDEECRLYDYAEHQYDKSKEDTIKGYYTSTGTGAIYGSVLAQYIDQTAETFISFGKLSVYAEKNNCKIFNYSLRSLLDCYEKRKL